MSAADATLAEQVQTALHRVCDPCSVAAHAPLSLVDMGLVHVDVDPEDGRVDVRMCVTSPCCTYGPLMAEAARRELESVPGVGPVQVTIDYTELWSPERMTPEGRASLDARRAASVALTGVKPRQWRASASASTGLPTRG